MKVMRYKAVRKLAFQATLLPNSNICERSIIGTVPILFSQAGIRAKLQCKALQIFIRVARLGIYPFASILAISG